MGNSASEEDNIYGDDNDEEMTSLGHGITVSPADVDGVFIVAREGQFLRYLIRPDSEVYYIADEIQETYAQRWKIFQNEDKDFAKPPIILKKCEYTEERIPVSSASEEEESEEEDDYPDHTYNSDDDLPKPLQTLKNIFFGKKDDNVLPFNSIKLEKEKQTDVEDESGPSMDFGSYYRSEEHIGMSTFFTPNSLSEMEVGQSQPTRLKNRKTAPNTSFMTTTENDLVKDHETYFFKKLGKNWDGWYTSEESNLLNIVKWARTKNLVGNNILDEIKKQHELNLKKGGMFNEEEKVISKLHEKFCHKIRSNQLYFQAIDVFISKALVMMSNIDYTKVSNENLKQDLAELNKFAGMYTRYKKELVLEDQN